MGTTTITVRLDEELRKALEERARVSGVSVSEVVRGALHEVLAERPLGERIGHLKGSLQLSEPPGSWGEKLRSRNWRP